MAGYLFSLDNFNSLIDCINKGVYSTKISHPKNGIWRVHQEGTFTDYSSMAYGDNVYFFIKRKIYGIGKLVNIVKNCKFLNYPNANLPILLNYNEIKNELILDLGEKFSTNYRFLCTFRPDPCFFKNGIDMDEVLSSAPNQFKVLRAFWKLSFVKFTDEENQAFKNILLRRNLEAINSPNNNNSYHSYFDQFHKTIESKIFNNNLYDLNIAPFLNTINDNGKIKHEMAIEASLIYQIYNKYDETIDIFGEWNYLSHQVIASPFKPVDYMDKMDVFGYRYIQNQAPTISNYLVIEIKKGVVCTQDILQLMKYVDWIKNEYAFGDYTMINAFIVGFNFKRDVIDNINNFIERKFIYGVRPSNSAEWKKVKLVKYSFNEREDKLDFQIINTVNE